MSDVYKVVSSNDREEFEKKINELVEQGYYIAEHNFKIDVLDEGKLTESVRYVALMTKRHW